MERRGWHGRVELLPFTDDVSDVIEDMDGLPLFELLGSIALAPRHRCYAALVPLHRAVFDVLGTLLRLLDFDLWSCNPRLASRRTASDMAMALKITVLPSRKEVKSD